MSVVAEHAGGPTLPKAPTGIRGLDEITQGGLPRGRTTLVAGGAGSGKTLLGLQFLVAGAREYAEPGVLLTFEESTAKVSANVASLGFDLDGLQRDQLLVADAFRVDPSRFGEAGEFNFEPLFILLDDSIERIGAKRVVLDSIELLFGAFRDQAVVRAELRRLFDWLEQRSVTAIVTGERGEQRAHAPRDRGVRVRLRDRSRPACARGDLHAPGQGGEVPRVGAREQRIPVRDLRSWVRRAAEHVGRSRVRRIGGADLDRRAAP